VVARTCDHGHTERGRFQQVVPAGGHQASADKGHIGGRVEILELT
jgi:hypothetical protein